MALAKLEASFPTCFSHLVRASNEIPIWHLLGATSSQKPPKSYARGYFHLRQLPHSLNLSRVTRLSRIFLERKSLSINVVAVTLYDSLWASSCKLLIDAVKNTLKRFTKSKP